MKHTRLTKALKRREFKLLFDRKVSNYGNRENKVYRANFSKNEAQKISKPGISSSIEKPS